MMKKVLFFIVILSAMLLVSCAPQVSDEELEAKLDELSDEELDAVIDESGQGKALAGQASFIEKKYLPTLKGTISKDRLLQSAQAVKIKRLEEQVGLIGDYQPSGTITQPSGTITQPSSPGETQGFNPQPDPPGTVN